MTKPNSRLKAVADAFADLTHRDMMDLADAFAQLLDQTNGMKVKPIVIAECLDGLGEYLAAEDPA